MSPHSEGPAPRSGGGGADHLQQQQQQDGPTHLVTQAGATAISAAPALVGVPNKRRRRSKAEIEALHAALVEELQQHHPQSVRHLYYRMLVLDFVEKTDGGYDTVQVQSVKLRRTCVIPYRWIVDGTRWRRAVKTYGGIADALAETARLYRRHLWTDTEVYLECWCESNGIAGVIFDVTSEYAVPLYPAKGFSSDGFLYPSARSLAEAANGRPAHVIYIGDWDPSGKLIPEKIEAGLRKHAPEAEIHSRRLAVNPDQIVAWNLPTKPAKASDSRSKSFTGETVEAEAVPVDVMRKLVRDAIEQFIDPDKLVITAVAEREERALLERWAEMLGAAP
jgi:hypothetical protein